MLLPLDGRGRAGGPQRLTDNVYPMEEWGAFSSLPGGAPFLWRSFRKLLLHRRCTQRQASTVTVLSWGIGGLLLSAILTAVLTAGALRLAHIATMNPKCSAKLRLFAGGLTWDHDRAVCIAWRSSSRPAPKHRSVGMAIPSVPCVPQSAPKGGGGEAVGGTDIEATAGCLRGARCGGIQPTLRSPCAVHRAWE
jgi:hypothetical protein